MKFSYSDQGGEAQFDISSGNQTIEITSKDMQDLKSMFIRLMKMASQGTNKHSGTTGQFIMREPALTSSNPLVEHPTISMQLTYNDTCPIAYEPKGFVVAPDPDIVLSQSGLGLGEMGTGYYRYTPLIACGFILLTA